MSKRSSINDIQASNKAPIKPRNPTQAKYLHSIKTNPQTFVLGPAGTGKTFLAAAAAIHMYLRQEVDRIIMTRPRVEVDEEWGFLPGKIEQKTAPWTVPLVEVFEEIAGKSRVENALRSKDIETVPLAFMRGRTLSRAFVILDEAQNTTVNQMKMFVTRIGEEARVVVNGDVAQKDLRGGSGLAWAVSMIERHEGLGEVVEFGIGDVERSAACAAWVNAIFTEEGLQCVDRTENAHELPHTHPVHANGRARPHLVVGR